MKYFYLIIALCQYSCKAQDITQNIVLVNVDSLEREGIANVISEVNERNPRVIAIDLRFVESKGANDLILINALDRCKKLVMSSVINNFGNGAMIISNMSSSQFMPSHARTGFVNVVQEKDEFNTVEKFLVLQKDFNGKTEYHFSVRTAMIYDSLKSMQFVTSHSAITKIDFKGGRKFKVISSKEILSTDISDNDIKDKIIIIGFLGPGIEDKFYTPLNSKRAPNEPDMYGAEYLANIVAQVLE